MNIGDEIFLLSHSPQTYHSVVIVPCRVVSFNDAVVCILGKKPAHGFRPDYLFYDGEGNGKNPVIDFVPKNASVNKDNPGCELFATKDEAEQKKKELLKENKK
jgi:hypothetical protein